MENPVQQKVLVGLDGTLALKDDAPNEPIIQVVRMLSISYPVTIVTGRSAELMAQSINWLHQYGVPYTDIVMRAEGDDTPEDECKAAMALHYNWTAETVLCVLDDRDSVVKMWRHRGLACLQVADGDC